jgi:hypothetical protein
VFDGDLGIFTQRADTTTRPQRGQHGGVTWGSGPLSP